MLIIYKSATTHNHGVDQINTPEKYELVKEEKTEFISEEKGCQVRQSSTAMVSYLLQLIIFPFRVYGSRSFRQRAREMKSTDVMCCCRNVIDAKGTFAMTLAFFRLSLKLSGIWITDHDEDEHRLNSKTKTDQLICARCFDRRCQVQPSLLKSNYWPILRASHIAFSRIPRSSYDREPVRLSDD